MIKYLRNIATYIFIIPALVFPAFAQDTIYVKHNNEAAGYLIPGNEECKIFVTPVLKEQSHTLTLLLNRGMYSNQAYVKSIELTNSDETERFEFPLHPATLETSDVSEALQKLKLFKGHAIKVFLLLNPPAEQMLFPSRRIPAGILMIKNS